MNEKELEERLKGLLQKGAIEECRELIDTNSNIDTKRISKIHLEVLDNLFLFKEGIERCLACVEKYPRDAIFPLMASKFHFSQSEVTESQLWLNKAISNSYPKYNWSELEISIEMLAQHGRYREMIERLETADEKRKSTAKWAMLKARALAGIGDVEKARSWYQVADGISGQTSPEIFHLISHPKSGYTWLRYIIAQILAVKGGQPLPQETIRITQLGKSLPSPILVKASHDGASLRAENGIEHDWNYLDLHSERKRYTNSRVIFVVRDPRDTIVSLYHQLSSRTTRPVGLTLSEFIRSPEYGWDRMMRFYAIWDANLRTPRSMLLMSYEGLLRSPGNGIEHVANFLGVKLSQEQVSKIADVSSAETMRQGERQGKIAQMRVLGSGLNALKVRKAKSGTYKEEMSEEDQLWCEKKMSDFPAVFSNLVKEKGADFIQLDNNIA